MHLHISVFKDWSYFACVLSPAFSLDYSSKGSNYEVAIWPETERDLWPTLLRTLELSPTSKWN